MPNLPACCVSLNPFSPCLSTCGATIKEGLQKKGNETEIIEHLTFYP